MISKVRITGFKRFREPVEFDLRPAGITFLAGGNNSGKSTLLQALAVWDFAKSVIQVSRGPSALLAGAAPQGVGLTYDEFSPIALPDLKHLWSNLHAKSQYHLKIGCEWQLGGTPTTYRLEVGLALANDRLFIKPVASSVAANVRVPKVAYLPPFAGIGSREPRIAGAARRRLIGRGLSGAVLRNVLFDLWATNRKERDLIRGTRKKIPAKALADLRRTDSWERLLLVLEEVFKTGLSVEDFNDLYHDTLEVRSWDGHLVQKQFRRRPAAPEKDLMVEGSGFLQWLSVYALAVDREIDVLMLDEPDAHLHPTLQGFLVHKLNQLALERGKQVLLATHSTAILGEADLGAVFRVEEGGYLSQESDRVRLFEGLGSAYAPRLDALKKSKRLFLHDGPSDVAVLQAIASVLGHVWPSHLVCWKYTKDREAREVLFSEFRKEIPQLKTLSLQDRDDYPFANTHPNLTFDSLAPWKSGLGLRRWRRRNIENYLLHPEAIARAAARPLDEVNALLQEHGLVVPHNFGDTDCPQTLANTDGKEVFSKNDRSIAKIFGVRPEQVAGAMQPHEVPTDMRTLVEEIVGFSK